MPAASAPAFSVPASASTPFGVGAATSAAPTAASTPFGVGAATSAAPTYTMPAASAPAFSVPASASSMPNLKSSSANTPRALSTTSNVADPNARMPAQAKCKLPSSLNVLPPATAHSLAGSVATTMPKSISEMPKQTPITGASRVPSQMVKGAKHNDFRTRISSVLGSLGVSAEEHQSLTSAFETMQGQLDQLDGIACELSSSSALCSSNHSSHSKLPTCEHLVHDCEARLLSLQSKVEGLGTLLQQLKGQQGHFLKQAVDLLHKDEPDLEMLHHLRLVPPLPEEMEKLKRRIVRLEQGARQLQRHLGSRTLDKVHQDLQTHAKMLWDHQRRVQDLSSRAELLANLSWANAREVPTMSDRGKANQGDGLSGPQVGMAAGECPYSMLRHLLRKRDQPAIKSRSAPDASSQDLAHSEQQAQPRTFNLATQQAEEATDQQQVSVKIGSRAPAATAGLKSHCSGLVSPSEGVSSSSQRLFSPPMRSPDQGLASERTSRQVSSEVQTSSLSRGVERPKVTLESSPSAATSAQFQLASSASASLGSFLSQPAGLFAPPPPTGSLCSCGTATSQPPAASVVPSRPADVVSQSIGLATKVPAPSLQITGDKKTTDEKKISALHQAAKDGELGQLRQLLDAGFEVDGGLMNQSGVTPLIYAASYGHTEALQMLLQAGANRSHKTNKGTTALEAARKKLNTKTEPQERQRFEKTIALLEASSPVTQVSRASLSSTSSIVPSIDPVMFSPGSVEGPITTGIGHGPAAVNATVAISSAVAPSVAAASVASASTPVSAATTRASVAAPPCVLPSTIGTAAGAGKATASKSSEASTMAASHANASPEEQRLKYYNTHRPATSAASVVFFRQASGLGPTANSASSATKQPAPTAAAPSAPPLSFGLSEAAPAISSLAAPFTASAAALTPAQPSMPASLSLTGFSIGGDSGGLGKSNSSPAPAVSSPFAPAAPSARSFSTMPIQGVDGLGGVMQQTAFMGTASPVSGSAYLSACPALIRSLCSAFPHIRQPRLFSCS